MEMYTSVVSMIADGMHFNPRAHSFNKKKKRWTFHFFCLKVIY